MKTSLSRGRAPNNQNPDTQEVNVISSPRGWGRAGGEVGQEILLPTKELHSDAVPEREHWQEPQDRVLSAATKMK